MLNIENISYSEERKVKLRKKIKELSPWYHSFDFGDDVKTEGNDFEFLWDNTKAMLAKLDYTGKSVLDLASWDGYWAFWAEGKGASEVVSTDIVVRGFKNLLFCREVLESNVIPLCNVPAQFLSERLAVGGLPEKYDVIQHFGLLHHLRDPMSSLAQARKMIKEDGILVIETPYLNNDNESYMAFSGGIDGKFHFYGASDTWVPTTKCLKEMLFRSGFEAVMEDEWQRTIPNNGRPIPEDRLPVARLAMVAKPISLAGMSQHDVNKMKDSTG